MRVRRPRLRSADQRSLYVRTYSTYVSKEEVTATSSSSLIEDGDESVERRRISAATTNFAESYESASYIERAFAPSTALAFQIATSLLFSPFPDPYFVFSLLLPLLLPLFLQSRRYEKKKKGGKMVLLRLAITDTDRGS